MTGMVKDSSRRRVLRHLLATAALAVGQRTAAFAPSSRHRPDLVLFIADDLSWSDIAPNGSPDARTPHLSQLAREGLRFTRAYAASPTCTPARSAMLTGDYPMRNGAHANHSSVRDGVRTLPAYLAALGYRVVIAGKTDFGPRAAFPFEYLAGSSVQGPQAKGVLGLRLDTGAVERLFATRDPAVPLALVVASYQPHVPWADNSGFDPAMLTLPATFVDTPETRAARARYLTDVADFDRELGDVRGSIARHGKPDDTLLVLTGDHGAQFPFAKWNLYDAGIHVPLIACWPGRVKPGSTAAMVSLTDLMPTVIEAVGGTAPRDIDGRSFLPVMAGHAATFRDTVFAAHTGDRNFNRSPMRCIRTDRWKLIHNLAPEPTYTNAMTMRPDEEKGFWASWIAAAARDPQAAATVHRFLHRPTYELYDLRADPDERVNLADEPGHAAIRATLAARLAAWRGDQGEAPGAVPMPEDAAYRQVDYGPWA